MNNYSDLILYDVSKSEDLAEQVGSDEELIILIRNAKNYDKEKVLISMTKLDSLIESSLNRSFLQNNETKDEVLVKCPKCQSTQITAIEKGYSAIKGFAGAFLTGGIGLIAGFHGAKDIYVCCLKCGNKWKAGKQQ